MKVTLREQVRVAGDGIVKQVDVARVDWERRCVWLPDGRWVPFENVAIGPAPTLAEPGRNGTIAVDATCERCGDPFPSPRALNGHKRHCVGRKQ